MASAQLPHAESLPQMLSAGTLGDVSLWLRGDPSCQASGWGHKEPAGLCKVHSGSSRGEVMRAVSTVASGGRRLPEAIGLATS